MGNTIRAKLADAGVLNPRNFTRDDARALVEYFDAVEFGGWFSRAGRAHGDVLGVFNVESNFDPDAIGDRHLSDMSWGIGQVRGTTAGDFGVTDPRALLDPATGVLTSMRYLKWAYEFLTDRMGRAPNLSEWIGSYNAGVGNVLRGFLPDQYLARWRTAAGRA